jgi:hypothetical protein
MEDGMKSYIIASGISKGDVSRPDWEWQTIDLLGFISEKLQEDRLTTKKEARYRLKFHQIVQAALKQHKKDAA